MPNPKPISFIPKWLRNDPDAIEADVGFMCGSVPDQPPRLVTRLVPKDHGYSLSARTLGKVIELKQSLVQYAARDVVMGLNPDFADLRSLKEPLTKFATLTIEPFESGSFVIPARLEAPGVLHEETKQPCETEAVIHRFNAMIAAIDNPDQAATISIGALLTCKELTKLLQREIETIEWSLYDCENNSLPTHTLDHARGMRLDKVLERRRPTEQTFETVVGQLTALDTETNEFKLALAGQRPRLKGTVMAFHMPWMRERLGQQIELAGYVVRDKKNVLQSITVHQVIEGGIE